RRGFFRSLKEFRRVEAEAADRVETAPPAPANPPEASLGSSCDETSTDPDDATPEAPRPESVADLSEFEVVSPLFHAGKASARRSPGAANSHPPGRLPCPPR